MFLVPKTDYTIIDNWHVMGMSGTGSKDFELKGEVFVPATSRVERQGAARRNGTGQRSSTAARCTACPVMRPCRSPLPLP